MYLSPAIVSPFGTTVLAFSPIMAEPGILAIQWRHAAVRLQHDALALDRHVVCLDEPPQQRQLKRPIDESGAETTPLTSRFIASPPSWAPARTRSPCRTGRILRQSPTSSS